AVKKTATAKKPAAPKKAAAPVKKPVVRRPRRKLVEAAEVIEFPDIITQAQPVEVEVFEFPANEDENSQD
ncbi:hypothetical protein, partial [Acidocella sp. KAb 2-4]|uniref:hypothetical protein n=1 Tax=Acidocella sp. KAb 2-4 TaxID=2885158 RepID=UPI001D06BB5D